MTLKQELFDLLDHLGQTLPVSAMPPDCDAQNLVCLRHDIDHSLDVALELAFWEHELGKRATYYLLNSAEYWTDPNFDDKVRQLLDFGHEVGVHFNSLANWLRGTCDDPQQDLLFSLERLRDIGANANTIAAHGDKLCYQYGVANFWMFSDEVLRLKGECPISAEGIPVQDDNYQISFPENQTIYREDGRAFTLGSLELESFGLSFLAHRAAWDRYFSDSGGKWTRSPDPMYVSDIRLGRSMVLIHPIHWRAPPRQIYVLSPARSGSKWLSQVANSASSALGVHEQTLNYRQQDGSGCELKRTHRDIDELYGDREECRSLLLDRKAWFETQSFDVFECNVYLAPLLEELKRVNPEALFVSLLRDPRKILVSLLNRGWYDTEFDHRHPSIDVVGWDSMGQVEKAAHYIAYIRECIASDAGMKFVDLEDLNQRPGALRDLFMSLGLAFYPVLAENFIGRKLNENIVSDIQSFDSLPEGEQLRALEIMFDGVSGTSLFPVKKSPLPVRNPRAFRREKREVELSKVEYGSSMGARLAHEMRLSGPRVQAAFVRAGILGKYRFKVPAGHNGAIMLGDARLRADRRSSWFGAAVRMLFARCYRLIGSRILDISSVKMKVADDDFDVLHESCHTYRFIVEGLECVGCWQVMVQTFDAAGKAFLLKRLLTEVNSESVDVAFSVPASAKSMRVVLYTSATGNERVLLFRSAYLQINRTVYSDVPCVDKLAVARVVVLASVGWSNDKGAPPAARLLANMGIGLIVWANVGGSRLDSLDFTYSEGVNFIDLTIGDQSSQLLEGIEKIRAVGAHCVVDLNNAAPQDLKLILSRLNIAVISASEKDIADEVLAFF